MIYAASAPAIECGFVLIELIGIQTVHMCKFPYFSSKKYIYHNQGVPKTY